MPTPISEIYKRKWAHLAPSCLPKRRPGVFEIMALVAYLKAYDFSWPIWVVAGIALLLRSLYVTVRNQAGLKMDIFEPYRNPPKEDDK